MLNFKRPTSAAPAGLSQDAPPATTTASADNPAKPVLYAELLAATEKERGRALSMDARLTLAEQHIAALEPQLATLTRERDEAVALAKNPTEQAARIMRESPSAAAAAILATAGAPAVQTRVDGTRNPAEAGRSNVAAGKTGLEAAVAKMSAQQKR